MKLLLIAFSLSVTLAGAAEEGQKVAKGQAAKSQVAKDQKDAKTQAAPAMIKAVEIPKDAVESEPGTFRHTDARGKQWIYRKTPFGVAKFADQPAAKSQARPPQTFDDVKAFDEGESVRFERPGPFGVYKWTTKKSDLDDMERKVWDRAKSKPAAK